jgi:Galactose oxidase, central domain
MPTLVSTAKPAAPLYPFGASPEAVLPSTTSLTLSCNGVQFNLTPRDSVSQLSFRTTVQGTIVLDLENFSGSLQVSPATPLKAPTSPHTGKTVVEQEPHSPENVHPSLVTVTPGQQTLGFEKKTKKQSKKRLSDVSNTVIKKTKKEKIALAQPTMEIPTQGIDMSQTMPSSSDPRSSSDAPDDTVMTAPEEPKETVQQILDRVNSTNDSVVGDDSNDEALTTTEVSMELTSTAAVTTAATNPEAHLALFNSYPPPSPRWGHTMTKLKNDRLLVYGGQSFDLDGKSIILSDVHVYHPDKKSWEKPINCRGEARQWHSATFLPERQLLLAFGGETYDQFATKKDKVITSDSLKVRFTFRAS